MLSADSQSIQALPKLPHRAKREFVRSRWFTGEMNPEQSEGNRPLDSTLSAVELFAMVRAYVKQETLDPLRGVGRWLAWGTAGAVALLFGAVVGLMGILRLLQAEIFDSTQAFSFVPYLIVAAVAVVLIWLSLTRIQRPSLHPEK